MGKIKLKFRSASERDTLLADFDFASEIMYLNPQPTAPDGLILTDTVRYHSHLDTEVVVLTMFARAFKRIIYPNTEHDIEFLSPFVNQSKIGIRHDNTILISENQREI